MEAAIDGVGAEACAWPAANRGWPGWPEMAACPDCCCWLWAAGAEGQNGEGDCAAHIAAAAAAVAPLRLKIGIAKF
jgi:hypothetical protein